MKKKTENPCSNCKYFTVCGDPDRTEPCKGREVRKDTEIYKLRIYRALGSLDHEEFFETKTEMNTRYRELFVYENFGVNPTTWKLENGEWKRLSGY